MRFLPPHFPVLVLTVVTVSGAWAQRDLTAPAKPVVSTRPSEVRSPASRSRKSARASRFPAKSPPPASNGQLQKTTDEVLVSIDPATGQIREPTAREIEELTRGTPPSEPGVSKGASQAAPAEGMTEAIRGAGGAIGMTLGPEFQREIVVTRTDAGKLRMDEAVGSVEASGRSNAEPSPRHETK